ncbi:hypothetical protein CRM22_007213 [Opisthorchis felineus]|uniref:Signal transducing adapter molecule 1 n=1 Tax=Opisthorchis felineus TaxID=147828 RepID=A0A4S2LQ72_OPIFE|nr:hypothetical protein CRM22_007213 [Opisthorchis felineus]
MTSIRSRIEQCTSEKNTQDQWDLILRICEEYGSKEPKACLKAIGKRIFHKNPNVSLRAITLLDACSKNCGKPFNREIASRDFTHSIKSRFSSLQRIPSVKLTEVFEKWAEEFKSDSELALAASLYSWVKSEHYDVIRHLLEDRQAIKAGSARQVAAQLKAREEEELAKAIALSLQESGNKRPAESGPSRTTQPNTATTTASSNLGKSNLYPEFAASTLPRAQAAPVKGRVRALYDFEAAEDNELTFKAGELIVLLDDSDENWWRGSNHRGEGLFPAQFVKCETEESPSSKKKDLNGPITETPKLSKPVQLDAKKLDECLNLISMVDPTGEFRPDPPELPQLEAECNAMAPLVDPELEKVDKRVLMLSELNQRLLDAFQMYHDLMSEPPPLSAPYYGGGAIPTGAAGYMPPMGAYGAPQPAAGGVPYGAGALHQSPAGVSYTAPPETMYPGHMACTSQYPQATTQPLSSAQYPPPAYYSATQHPVDTNPTSTRHQQPQQQQQHYAVSDIFPAAYSSQYPGGHTDPTQPGLPSRYPGTAEAPPNPYYYGYGTTVDGAHMDPSRQNNSAAMVAPTENPMG